MSALVDIASLRNWLTSWGDGPSWMDGSGRTVPIAKATLRALLGELEAARAAKREEPPWAELDDVIRETVRALWRAGFAPTDSGDGRKVGMACAIDVPHVFLRCDPAQLIAESSRLQALLTSWGLPAAAADGAPLIQASYAPSDGVAVLMLCGVCDEMLPPAARRGS